MTEPRCPQTGLPMVRGVRPITITYKGHSATIDMPGWYCEESDESIHTGDDMVVSDRALNRLKAKVQGLLAPEDVRRIRKALKLTQKEAGLIIGGGRNAFQKYESGEVRVSKAITSALLLLEQNPEGLNLLKALKGQARAA